MGLTGKPDDRVGRARVDDVVAVLSDLRAGTYERQDLYHRYATWVLGQNRTPASAQAFGAVLGGLGCQRETVWHVDPGHLRRRWRLLPLASG